MFENYFELSRWGDVYALGGRGTSMYRHELKKDKHGNLITEKTNENHESGLPVWQIGFEWLEMRDIRAFELEFADGYDSSGINEMYVQYWAGAWPTPSPSHRAGAQRGWEGTDDAFNRSFAEAFGEIEITDRKASMVFDHIDITEAQSLFSGAGDMFSSPDFNAFFRRTLKLRILFAAPEPPVIKSYRIIGNNIPEKSKCEIYTDVKGLGKKFSCEISLINGDILDKKSNGNVIELEYTHLDNPKAEGDKSSFEFKTDGEFYSFAVYTDDIKKGIYLPEYDMLITEPLNGISAEERVAALTAKESIYDRIEKENEQTFERAMSEIPEMDVTKQQPYGRYVILGWDGLRKKFCLRYNGDIFADKCLQKCARRDCAGTRWAGPMLHYRLSTGDPPTRREEKGFCRQHMPDAQVPFYVTEWVDREVEYTQSSFAILSDRTKIGTQLNGDEDMLVLNRMVIRNTSDTPLTGRLFIETMPSEVLEIKDDGILVAKGRVIPDDPVNYGWKTEMYDDELTRAYFKAEKGTMRTVPKPSDDSVTFSMRPGEFLIKTYYDGRRPKFTSSYSAASAFLYEVELSPFESTTIEFNIPYNTPTTKEGNEVLASYDFDGCKKQLYGFYEDFYSKAAKLELPEKLLNDFAKAVPWHIIMTAMREPVSGNYIVPAGTYAYTACGNEACMQIRLMDYLGYHEYAKKYLQTYANSQGRNGLDGNFKSKEGAFYALNYGGRGTNDDEFSYNLDHGYILTCFADHYFITGDKEWLKSVSQNLVDGCDFIIRERQATKLEKNGRKVSYYGLLPHGHLEDNREWRCWFAVNAHALCGMDRCARALTEIDHPEAKRLTEETKEYRRDIRFCIKECISHSPAVPDGNGGYMPHLPTHAEIRGRELGWFREAAYGPLHLTNGEALSVDEKPTEWILRDLEDNLFLSRDWGRIADRKKMWFSQGGITIQSNLIFTDLLYLQRNQPKYAVRALYNNFAQNVYRDMACFTEHPVPEFGYGYGPFFKTADEAQFLCNLRNHLVREDGDTLLLLQGAAMEWFSEGKTIRFEKMPTAFGRISLDMKSMRDKITLEINADWRKAPEKIKLYVRSAKIPKKRTVNNKDMLPDNDYLLLNSDSQNIVEIEY